jgi:transglutaminase-like putative cysteine protease
MNFSPFRAGAALVLSLGVLSAAEPNVATTDEVAELTRGPAPAWVEPVEWVPSRAARPGFPGEVLLSDSQNLLRDEGCDFYYRVVTRLLNREGVQQNAEETVTFSPEYQSIVWHTLKVHRGGEVIDLLPKVRFKRLQRELGLEGKVYDGRVTAVAVLEDIRVGDIVEIAYTRRDTNPLTKNYPTLRLSIGAGYPVVRQTVVARRPADQSKLTWYFFLPPDTHGLPEDIFSAARLRGALRDRSTDDEQIFRWERENIDGIQFDQSISGEAAPYYPTLRWSAYDRWSKVVEWALPLFETGEALPAAQQELVATWNRLPEARARLRAAVDWVQGDVRYFSMAFGQHNVKPRSLAEIAATRFGDCKDKSVLLARLLREVGIPAWPALVNTYSEHLVRTGGPDVHAFNHAIVAYELDGTLRWVDPTLRQPAGRAGEWELPAPYSPALILRENEYRLTDLPRPKNDRPDSETIDRIRLDADGTGEIATEIQLHGLQADFYRTSLDEVSTEQRSKGWFNFIARFYRELEEVEAPVVTDDRDQNVLTLRARYRVPNLLRTEGGVQFAVFHAYALRTVIENPESRRRHWPLALPFGRYLRHRIEVETPQSVATFVRPAVVQTREFEYRTEKAMVDRRYTAVHELQFNVRHVAPERMGLFTNSLEEVFAEMTGVIRFPSLPPEEGPVRESPKP